MRVLASCLLASGIAALEVGLRKRVLERSSKVSEAVVEKNLLNYYNV